MDTLEFERIDSVALVRLNRPQKLNAINSVMLDELDAVLNEIDASDASMLILTGTGRAFCSGSDISGDDLHEDGTSSFAEARIRRMHALLLRLTSFRQPSIAALNGLAYGGGLELSLACTFRTAAPDTKLCMPEIQHSLVPSYGGTQLLPRMIGAGRALEMMLTGESINAAQALQFGLVTVVAPDPVEAAIALTTRLPNGAGLAQRMIRRAVALGAGMELPAALRLERELAMEIAVSAQAREGAALFKGRKRTDSSA